MDIMKNNKNSLPEIHRQIASAIVISKDGKILMGRKEPKGGGVYSELWHIPGGGKEEGETLEEAMRRELGQEVVGIDIADAEIEAIPQVGHGETTKVIDGAKYWCKMEFNRFFVRLNQNADDIKVEAGDDLVELRWFSRKELADVEQIPGGKEFFQSIGLID